MEIEQTKHLKCIIIVKTSNRSNNIFCFYKIYLDKIFNKNFLFINFFLKNFVSKCKLKWRFLTKILYNSCCFHQYFTFRKQRHKFIIKFSMKGKVECIQPPTKLHKDNTIAFCFCFHCYIIWLFLLYKYL